MRRGLPRTPSPPCNIGYGVQMPGRTDGFEPDGSRRAAGCFGAYASAAMRSAKVIGRRDLPKVNCFGRLASLPTRRSSVRSCQASATSSARLVQQNQQIVERRQTALIDRRLNDSRNSVGLNAAIRSACSLTWRGYLTRSAEKHFSRAGAGSSNHPHPWITIGRRQMCESGQLAPAVLLRCPGGG